jgi:hypothetical protein
MTRYSTLLPTVVLLASWLSSTATAQEPARGRGAAPPRATRPPLFLRQEWNQTPAGGEHPVVLSEALSNPNIELELYSAAGKDIQLEAAMVPEAGSISRRLRSSRGRSTDDGSG